LKHLAMAVFFVFKPAAVLIGQVLGHSFQMDAISNETVSAP
jgi:hypothetical protein